MPHIAEQSPDIIDIKKTNTLNYRGGTIGVFQAPFEDMLVEILRNKFRGVSTQVHLDVSKFTFYQMAGFRISAFYTDGLVRSIQDGEVITRDASYLLIHGENTLPKVVTLLSGLEVLPNGQLNVLETEEDLQLFDKELKRAKHRLRTMIPSSDKKNPLSMVVRGRILTY